MIEDPIKLVEAAIHDLKGEVYRKKGDIEDRLKDYVYDMFFTCESEEEMEDIKDGALEVIRVLTKLIKNY